MIHIEDRHMKIIQEILSQYPFTFYAFGSRARGTHKPFSDLDLCVLEDLPPLSKCYLQEAFEEPIYPLKLILLNGTKSQKSFKR